MFTRALLFCSLLLILAAPTEAYMGLIRQGAESAEVPNALDHFGDRVATGDFNGDGYDDVAIAAPDENNDIGVGGKHGVVIVSYGSAAGIVHGHASVLSVGAPSDFNVWFGKGLAAGDFNGDGVDDLAVGLPGADDIGADDIGGVWVYAGIQDVGISLAPYIQLEQADCGTANEAGDQFGYTLAAGDMTLDGFDDLFVGSIGEDNDAGLVAFFPGSAGGVTPTGSGFAKQSHLGYTDEAGSLFGYSLALGNFLDDEYLELAIGAPKADEGSLLDMGRVYIVRGTALGPIVANPEVLTPLSLQIPLQLGRLFGWSLAAGSFLDEDGARPDLAIGEPHFYSEGVTTSGRVVVVDYDGAGDAIHVSPRILDQGTLGEQINAGAAFGWTLAAGNMMTNGGDLGPDGMEDLAIGAPNDDVLVPGATEAIYWDNVGSAYVVPGSFSNFSVANTRVIDAMERNDLWFGFDEKLGWSLAFGKFDDTGWDNLAIGVPNKKYPAFIETETEKVEAGQVYIMAPWRQPQGKPHRSSIVQDCAGRILYAQRMGQRLTPASTTKAITALIAAEAMDNGTVDPNQLYTIPEWVAKRVTGSQYGLFEGERISFRNLVRTMIAVSGNDCAYAIGNILTGEDNVWDTNQSTNWNLEHILSDFAAMMQAKAAQLGMSSAHKFNNPAGRPVGQHWTTAQDMAIFVAEAMKNDTFADIVGTTNWPNVMRQIPSAALFPNIIFPPGAMTQVFDSVSNGYYSSILSRDPRATGVKGGWNSVSMATGLYSAKVTNGYAKATIFGVPPYGWLADLGQELMSLVGSDCEPSQVVPAFPVPNRYVYQLEENLPLDPDRTHVLTAVPDREDLDDVAVEIERVEMPTETTCLELVIERSTEFEFVGESSRSFGCQNRLKQFGIALHNRNDEKVARLSLSMPSLGYDEDVAIEPGQTFVIPVSEPVAGQDGVDLLIVNNGDGNDFLAVDESYEFDVRLGQDRLTPPDWRTLIKRDGRFEREIVRARLTGCGPVDGNTVRVAIRNGSLISTAVDDLDPTPLSRGAIAGLSNYPNPFNPRTTIAFELAASADVSVRIYDLAGRLVRTLESGQTFARGEHELVWDGTGQRGETVASGVYLVRVDDGRRPQAKRVTLLK